MHLHVLVLAMGNGPAPPSDKAACGTNSKEEIVVDRSAQHTGSIGTVPRRASRTRWTSSIVGSGGAGLMAALTAAKEGARVLVVESRELVGGATGISAGAAWIPNHGFSTKELKVNDDLDQARRYIYGQGRDQTLDHDLVEKFLETGPHVARYIEEHTSFGWIPTIWPDYRSDIDGASVGRALFPGPYSPEGLGEAAKYVRPALTTGMAKNPLPFWLLGGIGIDDVWLAGPALVGALLEAGLRNGVDVRVEAPAVRLVTDESGVHGVVVRADGVEHTVRATRGVLLASGGFESSTEPTTTHLDAPFGVQVSPEGPRRHRGPAGRGGRRRPDRHGGRLVDARRAAARRRARGPPAQPGVPRRARTAAQHHGEQPGRALRERGPGLRPVRRRSCARSTPRPAPCPTPPRG